MIYDGQTVRFTTTFRTAAGVATNPTTVTMRLRSPSGTETAYVYGTDEEITLTSTGVYALTVQLTEPGEWWCRSEGTGAVAAVDELAKAVVVTASHFTTIAP